MPFTPLTPDQYQSAIKAGFTPDQIIANEQTRKQQAMSLPTASPTTGTAKAPGFFSSVGQDLVNQPLGQEITGIAKGIGSTAAGLESVAQKGLQFLGNPLTSLASKLPGIQGKNLPDSPTMTQQFGKALAPSNIVQGVGYGLEKVGELVAPTDIISAGKEAVAGFDAAKAAAKIPGIGGAVSKGIDTIKGLPYAGKALSYAAQKVLNALPEAGFGGAYGLTESGGSGKEAVKSAAAFGVLSGLGEVVGDSWRAFKGGVADNIQKALGMTGKMTPQQAVERVPQQLRAFKAMANLANDIKVKTADGIEKAWEPTKDGFYEGLQALQQTKQKVYDTYTELAKQAGGEGASFTAKDFESVIKSLKSSVKDSTGAFKNKAESLIQDLISNFGKLDEEGNPVFKNIDLGRIQKFIESVNTDVNPLSDKAASEVSQTLSKNLRSIMDNKIESATGEGYQKLRNNYADLKSIENDMVNQFKKISRKVGGRVGQYVESFGTLEGALGLLSKNPVELARGAGEFAIGKLMNYLRDPETGLQNAFKDILGQAPGSLETRALGGAKPAAPPAPATYDIGGTSFRGTPVTTIKDTLPYYNTARAKGFENSIQNLGQELNLKVTPPSRVAGVWEGKLEPSFNWSATGQNKSVFQYASELGQKGNQDAMILFSPGKGTGSKYVFADVKNPQAVIKQLQDAGISGATIDKNNVLVYDFDGSLKENISKLSDNLGIKPTQTNGTAKLITRDQYGQYARPRSSANVGSSPNANVPPTGTNSAKVTTPPTRRLFK